MRSIPDSTHPEQLRECQQQSESMEKWVDDLYHPAQMACSVSRQVGATYKTLWSKVKQNAQARAAGLTRKRYKGLDQPPKYVSPTLTYQEGKDYSFKKERRVSVLTLASKS